MDFPVLGDVLTAEQVEKEAYVQLGMVSNIRDGMIRAIRDEHGAIRYEITDKGRKMVEEMGK